MLVETTITDAAKRFAIPERSLTGLIKRNGLVGRDTEAGRTVYRTDAVQLIVEHYRNSSLEEARSVVAGDAAEPETSQDESDQAADAEGEEEFNPEQFVDESLMRAFDNAMKSYRRALMKAIDLAATMDDEDLQLEMLQHYVKGKSRVPKALAAMVLEYSGEAE